MLSFASPQYAWTLVLPAAVIVLYLLRRRYAPRPVPSTFLWKKSMRDHAANRPLQRLRKNILFPVQLAAMLALCLGLMQPAVSGGAAGRTILIFDVSGSMQAETDGKTRLELAQERAAKTVDGLPAGERITVLACGEETRQLALDTRDREEVRRAIGSLQCEKGGADPEQALSLAEAIRRENGETGARIIVFSDTFVPKTDVAAVNVGEGADNRAIRAVTAEEGQVYVRVANYGADCTLTLTCHADGQLAEAKELQIPEGETAGVRFAIPEGASTAEVRIRESDAIAADNRVRAAVARNTARTAALTEDNLFLESALRVRDDLTVVRASVDNPESVAADLYILGENPVIFTLHPAETAFSWGEEKAADAPLAKAADDDPLTAGLTLRDVAMRAFRPVSGGITLLTCGGETAAAATDTEVIIGFDLHDSNLPMKYDFPVLIQNILEKLIPRKTVDAPDTEAPMPAEESDVRYVARSAEGSGAGGETDRNRDLSIWFIGAFLALLLAEFLLARFV